MIYNLKEAFKGEWRQLLIVIIVILIGISLSDTLIYLFNTWIVDEGLSAFNMDGYMIFPFLLYVIALFTISIICIMHLWNNVHKTSLVNITFLATALYLYWLERFVLVKYFHHDLLHKSIYQSNVSKLDPIALVFTISLIILIFNRFRQLNYNINKNNIFIQDLPITQIGHDQFNRKVFFEGITEKIKNITFDGDRGFAIGIISKWGNGKTSFLNILKNDLNDKNTIIVEFNPWLSTDSQNLTNDFFNTLEIELSKFIETKSLIRQYGQALTHIENDKNPFRYLSPLTGKEKSFEQSFSEITSIIKKVNKRIFIIIDDADRLDNEEVFELLRMIRNSGNFPRVNFIVTYDNNYIKKSLINKRIYKPSLYIKKIFDFEFPLPNIPGESLQKALFDLIKPLLDKTKQTINEKNEIIDQIKKCIYSEPSLVDKHTKYHVISNYLNTLVLNKRDVIRFYNSFALAYSINFKFIYVPDLFILELIKTFNLNTYVTLAKDNLYLSIQEDEKNKRFYTIYQEEKEIDFIDLRVGLYDLIQKTNDPILKDLINGLFYIPPHLDFEARKSIVYLENFETYFSYAQIGLSFDEIDTLLKN